MKGKTEVNRDIEESPRPVVNKEFLAEEVTREREGRKVKEVIRVTREIKVLEVTKEKEETPVGHALVYTPTNHFTQIVPHNVTLPLLKYPKPLKHNAHLSIYRT